MHNSFSMYNICGQGIPNFGAEGRQQLRCTNSLPIYPTHKCSLERARGSQLYSRKGSCSYVRAGILPDTCWLAGQSGSGGGTQKSRTPMQESLVAGVKTQHDTMVDSMPQLVQRIEKLELHEFGPVADQGAKQRRSYQASGRVTRDPKTVVPGGPLPVGMCPTQHAQKQETSVREARQRGVQPWPTCFRNHKPSM